MKLGDIIKNYTETHTLQSFCDKSGISRAYAYLLIKDKNNNGSPITPSLSTIMNVAVGVDMSFDQIIDLLDYDYIVRVKSKEATQNETPESKEIIEKEIEAIKRIDLPKEEQDAVFLDRARSDTRFLEYMRKVFNLKEEYREEIYHYIDYTYNREKNESEKVSTLSQGA